MAIITLSSFTHHGMAGCAYNIITLSSPSALPSSSLDISMTGKVWKMSNQLSAMLCFVFLSIPVIFLLILQTFTKMIELKFMSFSNICLDKVEIISKKFPIYFLSCCYFFIIFFIIIQNFEFWKVLVLLWPNFSQILGP